MLYSINDEVSTEESSPSSVPFLDKLCNIAPSEWLGTCQACIPVLNGQDKVGVV